MGHSHSVKNGKNKVHKIAINFVAVQDKIRAYCNFFYVVQWGSAENFSSIGATFSIQSERVIKEENVGELDVTTGFN